MLVGQSNREGVYDEILSADDVILSRTQHFDRPAVRPALIVDDLIVGKSHKVSITYMVLYLRSKSIIVRQKGRNGPYQSLKLIFSEVCRARAFVDQSSSKASGLSSSGDAAAS